MAEIQDQELVVSVADQGTGIIKAAQARLFERFFQADSHWSFGVGLGLYISKQIIDRHGGRIGVRSKPGKGSTFYFSLPVIQLAAAATRRKETSHR
jgi:signal transduction histidine kinase